jgi:hypothetical protein
MKKGDAVKIILKGLLYGGGFVALSIASPTFPAKIFPQLIKWARYELKKKQYKKRKFYNAFYYLKKQDLVNMEYRGKQLYISLTKEGKKKAGRYQIDDLKIAKPSRWDGKWRLLIFDIEDKQKLKREALRGKLKELGLFQLQKSVWICPYFFRKEIGILRQFFGFTLKEMKVITALEIEGDREARQYFRL